MGTHPGRIQRPLVSHSHAGVSPCVFTHPQREGSTLPSLPALGAFADGFGGSLIGGLMYCLVLVYFHPDGLEVACLRVVALSLTFGGFEMWRVRRKRTLKSVRTCMLWTLIASLFVLWALGAVISSTDSSRHKTPPNSNQNGLALRVRSNILARDPQLPHHRV